MEKINVQQYLDDVQTLWKANQIAKTSYSQHFKEYDSQLVALEDKLLQLTAATTSTVATANDLNKRVAWVENVILQCNSLHETFTQYSSQVTSILSTTESSFNRLSGAFDAAVSRREGMSVELKYNVGQAELAKKELKLFESHKEALRQVLTALDGAVLNAIDLTVYNDTLDKIIGEMESRQSVELTQLESELVQMETEFTVLFSKMEQLIADLDQIGTNLQLLEGQLTGYISRINSLYDSTNSAQKFYKTFYAKLRATENFLNTFIIAGRNTHLDFENGKTIVHAVPPEQPECLEPVYPITTTTSSPKLGKVTSNPTAGPASSTGSGSSGGGSTNNATTGAPPSAAKPSTAKPSTAKPPTAKPPTTSGAPASEWTCAPWDTTSIGGCLLIVASVPGGQYDAIHQNYDGEIYHFWCYAPAGSWNNQSKDMASAAAKLTLSQLQDPSSYYNSLDWSSLTNTSGNSTPGAKASWRIVEVTSPTKCADLWYANTYK